MSEINERISMRNFETKKGKQSTEERKEIQKGMYHILTRMT